MNKSTFENIRTGLIVTGIVIVTGSLWGIVILMRNDGYQYITPVIIVIGLLTVSVYLVSKWKWNKETEEE